MKPGDLVIIFGAPDADPFGVHEDDLGIAIGISRGKPALVVGINADPHIQLLVDGLPLWVPIRFVVPS